MEKIKGSTIARIAALIVALVNEFLALFGRGALPFTENMAYQVVSLVLTVAVAAINCWYNNDITKAARLAGSVFAALKDGRITEAELQSIFEEAKKTEGENNNGSGS